MEHVESVSEFFHFVADAALAVVNDQSKTFCRQQNKSSLPRHILPYISFMGAAIPASFTYFNCQQFFFKKNSCWLFLNLALPAVPLPLPSTVHYFDILYRLLMSLILHKLEPVTINLKALKIMKLFCSNTKTLIYFCFNSISHDKDVLLHLFLLPFSEVYNNSS